MAGEVDWEEEFDASFDFFVGESSFLGVSRVNGSRKEREGGSRGKIAFEAIEKEILSGGGVFRSVRGLSE